MRQHRKKPNNRYPALALIILGALVVTGCSEPPKQTATPVAQSKPVQKQPIATALTSTVTPTVEEKPASVYSYNPGGRRDPFAPIIVKETKKAKAGDRPPLERYNLTEYKLSGIVWGGFGYNAILEGPDGKGYFVRTGTILGPNRGVVKKITQNTLVVEEKFKNYAGETERKEIIIELRKKQEEAP